MSGLEVQTDLEEMEREEGGQLGPKDRTRDFIAIAGEFSLRRGQSLDEERREDEQGWEGLDRDPLDPQRRGSRGIVPSILQLPIPELRMHLDFRICPPIRLLDRPDPAPGGMSLNASGPGCQPCLH